MIKVENKDYIYEIEDHTKFCGRSSKIQLPIEELNKLININLPDETIDADDFGEIYNLSLIKDKNNKKYLQLELTYSYSLLATKEDIEREIKKSALERITTLKENLKLLCGKYDITMEQLHEMIK